MEVTVITFFVLIMVLIPGQAPEELANKQVNTQQECIAEASTWVEDAITGEGKNHPEYELFAVCKVKKDNSRPA
jgi:hypothetical protein